MGCVGGASLGSRGKGLVKGEADDIFVFQRLLSLKNYDISLENLFYIASVGGSTSAPAYNGGVGHSPTLHILLQSTYRTTPTECWLAKVKYQAIVLGLFEFYRTQDFRFNVRPICNICI